MHNITDKELETFCILKYGSIVKMHYQWSHSQEDILTYQEKLIILYSDEVNFANMRHMEEHRINVLRIMHGVFY